PGGLRHRDEPVRHKMLDAVGDLALAGAPLLARYTGNRAGHAMTNRLLRTLFATEGAWEWTELTSEAQQRMLGAGVPGLCPPVADTAPATAAAKSAARARAVA